ncbi:MAG: family 16 glycosylhydrolase [Calditrichia bacterium]
MKNYDYLQIEQKTEVKNLKQFRVFAIYLILFAAVAGSYGKTYKGAELRTNEAYKYGRFEVRMKSGQGSGMLSSFFTYYDGGGGSATWNEIDIEIMGRYLNEAQYNAITPGTSYQVNHVYRDTLHFNPHDNFHVYAFEWTPDYVAWLVDGVETFRQTGDHIKTLTHSQKIMMNIWPPDYPDWAGILDPASLPIFAYYDWVKYYAYTPGDSTNFTLQWTAPFDSWDQAHWSKASHTWDGNNSDFIYDNAVFRDGYLILCLTTGSSVGYSGAPVSDQDNVPPYAVWARKTGSRVDLYFSEILEKSAAEKTGNYLMTGVTIQSAQLHPDGQTVTLQTSPLEPGKSYNLILTDISDTAGNKMSLQHLVPQAYPELPLKINVGGTAAAEYVGDQTYDYSENYGTTGGSPFEVSGAVDILGTEQDEIYRSEQKGLTFYQVRLPNGHYSVDLLFAETEMNDAGQRVFNVHAEGKTVLSMVDIFASAGAKTAYRLTIPDVGVKDGLLDLYFEPLINKAVLSGIEIEANASSIGGKSEIPSEFQLGLYPNPFNATARIQYCLPRTADVSMDLFDISGQLIKKLVDRRQSAGNHSFMLNGEGMSSGLYFCRILVDGNLAAVHKAVLVK